MYVPSKTMEAGPVKYSLEIVDSFGMVTVRISFSVVKKFMGEGTLKKVCRVRAEADIPVPQADVSSSTPRSYVLIKYKFLYSEWSESTF